jgi:alpha-D-xyloside xylohydrolase
MRRLETAVFSPLAQVDSWYIKNPPWRQYDTDKNNRDELLPDYPVIEKQCLRLFNWRMRLIPYLYAAFSQYRFEGLPPFRSLALDYPEDRKTYDIDNEYMMGDSLLIAPLFAGETKRTAYLPPGDWYDLWTLEKLTGRQEYQREADINTIPVFVKANTLLPLAVPLQHIADDTVFDIDVYAFGATCDPFILFEDDGISFDHERGAFSRVLLRYDGDRSAVERQGGHSVQKYRISKWVNVLAEPVDFRNL